MESRTFDALDLYERTVQDADRTVELLHAVHGAEPRILGEDFAGSAALSRAWVARGPDRRAFAVDVDGAALARGTHPRITAHVHDVRSSEIRVLGPCDVVHAGNFSIGELGVRAEFLDWARNARSRLAPGGIVALDTYGGESAWRVGALERRRVLADGVEIRWCFEQRSADPRTARVVNALSFRVVRKSEVVASFPDAFVYRWRLWSIPEIVDVLREVGFEEVRVRTRLDDDAPVEVEIGASCVALISARR